MCHLGLSSYNSSYLGPILSDFIEKCYIETSLLRFKFSDVHNEVRQTYHAESEQEKCFFSRISNSKASYIVGTEQKILREIVRHR